jgi:hypothetical protein
VTRRQVWSYGPGSPQGVPGFGGFTDVATALTAVTPERPVTRQLVYVWWRRRETTGFPDRVEKRLPGGETHQVFDLAETVAWYERRVATQRAS